MNFIFFSALLGAFAYNLRISNSLNAELNGVMYAIELAAQKGWSHIWLEIDSMLVNLAFKSHKLVPWNLKNIWENCLHIISSMSIIVTHVYREGNHCADKPASIRLTVQHSEWWDQVLPQIRSDFVRNRMGLPYFRFC